MLKINLYVHDSSHHVINSNFNNKVLFYFYCHISLFDQMVHLIISLIKIKDVLYNRDYDNEKQVYSNFNINRS